MIFCTTLRSVQLLYSVDSPELQTRRRIAAPHMFSRFISALKEHSMNRDYGSMVRRFHVIVCSMAGMLLASGAGAAMRTSAPGPAPAVAAAPTEMQELAGLWMRGMRLSADIKTAENEFIGLYNKLNKRLISFDIFCGKMSLDPGSMTMKRSCRPHDRYPSNPIYISITGQLESTNNYNSYRDPPVVLTAKYSDKLVDSLLKLTSGASSDPQLVAKAAQLEKLYAEMRQVQGQYASLDVDEKARAKAVRKLARSGNDGALP
jgi:hypothetical protein